MYVKELSFIVKYSVIDGINISPSTNTRILFSYGNASPTGFTISNTVVLPSTASSSVLITDAEELASLVIIYVINASTAGIEVKLIPTQFGLA